MGISHEDFLKYGEQIKKVKRDVVDGKPVANFYCVVSEGKDEKGKEIKKVRSLQVDISQSHGVSPEHIIVEHLEKGFLTEEPKV